MACFDVDLRSDGSAVPSPSELVAIPGIYDAKQPSLSYVIAPWRDYRPALADFAASTSTNVLRATRYLGRRYGRAVPTVRAPSARSSFRTSLRRAPGPAGQERPLLRRSQPHRPSIRLQRRSPSPRPLRRPTPLVRARRVIASSCSLSCCLLSLQAESKSGAPWSAQLFVRS